MAAESHRGRIENYVDQTDRELVLQSLADVIPRYAPDVLRQSPSISVGHGHLSRALSLIVVSGDVGERVRKRRLDDYAFRCFRDIADGDYVSARMACRAELVGQFLWASQQVIEKYLKCILLLNRIEARKVRHDLRQALEKLADGDIELELTSRTKEFIAYVDELGQYRYLEKSQYTFGSELVALDRAVWELRRFCTLDRSVRETRLREGFPAPKVRVQGGYLKRIIDNARSPAREPLLWRNGFFGKRIRRSVPPIAFTVKNSPLVHHADLLDEVEKYVFVPETIKKLYRASDSPTSGLTERTSSLPRNASTYLVTESATRGTLVVEVSKIGTSMSPISST